MSEIRETSSFANADELTIEKLEEKIEVRNEPHIYAFRTHTIPDYIKVGDTFRPIEKRLNEWKQKYDGLERLFPKEDSESEGLATVNQDVYFRDYSLHKYFEDNYLHCRIKKDNEIFLKDSTIYFSDEFFKDINIDTIKAGIKEIKEDYNNETRIYDFYKLLEKKPNESHWNNNQDWKLRDNQKEVVENFLAKVDSQKELLMYAVMRFGKSFTSLMCAKAKEYKKILVVSAKADVVGEWKQTVEKPKCFKDYAFLCDKNFVEYSGKNKDLIEDILQNKISDNEYLKNKNRVVVFLTLQNLSGKADDGKNIKTKLKQVYDTHFDLVIIDETHYGAWAKCYGSPLTNTEEDDDSIKKD